MDYGCGSGALAAHIAPDAYTGVDRDGASLSNAERSFPNHAFLKPEALPEDSRFDVITALAIIEHTPSPAEFLKMLAKRMKDEDSRIILTTPLPVGDFILDFGSRLGLFSKHAHEEHQTLLDRRGIGQAAEEANLEMEHYSRFLGGLNQLAVLRRRSR